jgi:hypothetical protein
LIGGAVPHIAAYSRNACSVALFTGFNRIAVAANGDRSRIAAIFFPDARRQEDVLSLSIDVQLS